MNRLIICCLMAVTLQACGKSKHLEIGTGSRIDVLSSKDQFYKNKMPVGWVLEGIDEDDAFETRNQLPNIYMTAKEGQRGVHIQSSDENFILARYTRARLLVSPFLIWNWHLSEHRSEDHPVSLIVGFHGGHSESEPLTREDMIWKGENLPPFDRIISIGFNDMALRRGNLFSKGKMKFYVQRGGIEQTNMWHNEAVDLSLIYRRAWPQDKMRNVIVTFVGMMAQNDPESGGMTFSSIRLSR